MLNCGLTDLRIVNPRDGWPSDRANTASSGAFESGVVPTLYDTTIDAIKDLHFTLATTARPRGMIKDVYTPKGGIKKTIETTSEGQKVGILFGAERTGLENDDIAMVNGIITAPLNPDFSSLNLAQAVLMVSYEYMSQMDGTDDVITHTGKTDIASMETKNQFTDRFIGALADSDFFKSEEMRPTIERSLTNLISRHDWTEQEIQTLHGAISAFIKK